VTLSGVLRKGKKVPKESEVYDTGLEPDAHGCRCQLSYVTLRLPPFLSGPHCPSFPPTCQLTKTGLMMIKYIILHFIVLGATQAISLCNLHASSELAVLHARAKNLANVVKSWSKLNSCTSVIQSSWNRSLTFPLKSSYIGQLNKA
jgi:hypothetical protein